MVMYIACDTFMENYLTTLDSTFFLKLMTENQGHSGPLTVYLVCEHILGSRSQYDSVTPRCVHTPNLGFLGFLIVKRFSRSDGSGKGA